MNARLHLAIVAAVAALIAPRIAADPATVSDTTTTTCTGAGHHIVVEAPTKTLTLCAGDNVVHQYEVNLGRGGLHKSQAGDGKTPVGTYALSAPRPSHSGFYTFIPVGYPTPTQQQAGFTGGQIGIHGPPDWLPEAVVGLAFGTPWTAGCIMVATRSDIDAIAAFVVRHRIDRIEIRDT